jgi:uncharacterized protein YeaO (DUF488 family)
MSIDRKVAIKAPIGQRGRKMRRGISAANVRLKRAYAPPARIDGTRILIDRLWPRGVTKKSAAIDEWFKEIAPSTALRQWFGHDPARWQEFRRRYAREVLEQHDQFDRLRTLALRGAITLVFSAHDQIHNDAVVLRDLLLGRRVKANAQLSVDGRSMEPVNPSS